MNYIRILGIAPYPGLESIMQKLAAKQQEVQMTTVIGNLSNWKEVLSEVSISSYDVIISRGGTARMLSRFFQIPVVEITTSVYDMLCSLRNAQGYTGKIAVVGHSNITERAKQLAEIMQYDISICSIDDNTDIKQELLRLKKEGCNLVLGDIVSKHSAEELGINSMLIISSEQSVQDAIDEAVRLIKVNNRFSCQNELFQKLIQKEGDDIAVFYKDARLYYSNRAKCEENKAFFNMLKENFPKVEALASDTEIEIKQEPFHISAKLLEIQNENFIVLRIKKHKFLNFSSENGISFYNLADFRAEKNMSISIPACVGDVNSVIENYAAAPFPVLIMGNEGSGKDYAAIQIYRRSKKHQNAFISLDCQLLSDKQWKQLLESNTSPMLQTEITLYFKNLHRLSNELAENLFHFIEISSSYSLNRLIFSAEYNENYPCTYLQGHFSTVVLYLPPLKERRKDIPNLIALSVNQLNILLGKQVAGFTDEAVLLMKEFSWDKNLAQFDRIVRTIMMKAKAPYIDANLVKQVLQEEASCKYYSKESLGYSLINLQQSLADIEYDVIKQVLQQEHNNQSKTAKRLKIGRSTLWSILKKHEE